MTDLAAYDVATRTLITYGAERYEDAVIYRAVRRYLDDIGAIPAAAWGTLPEVSERLARDWQTSLASRVDEAIDASTEMDRIADALLQIAADYEHADLHIATTFDLVNRDLKPYLPTADGYTGDLRLHPGGTGVMTPPPHHHRDERPTVVVPPDNDRLAATRHETLPRTRTVEEPLTIGTSDGNNLIISGGRSTHYEGGAGDPLDQFVQHHRSDLLQLEALLTELGTGHRMPLSDLIIHAWRSVPAIIRNRADLLHSVANTYAETRTNFGEETTSLARYWRGTAGDAYIQHARAYRTWLDHLHTQAAWLADEGKKAASLLEGLRNAYANAGYQRISTLLEAMHAYITAINSPFAACSKPETAFLNAVDVFTNYLIQAERNAVDLAADLLTIDEQERKERPDLGTRNHDRTPLPVSALDYDTWTNRAGWSPRPADAEHP
ncbi:hypothetical protein [Mangrovihabitans endophyticus]|uniref:Uncharacterized protein n=1 Tax=Mangrovihabitans endophyticus TaxID=1751298 RepID=A0A8J3FQ07_9ACTN|nr:hypothetical protein [Mangrovihabitans endophyticus]GGK99754.1 hypothetical protein GCM10012284_37700 [Mangrovihabitans endophyticus]